MFGRGKSIKIPDMLASKRSDSPPKVPKNWCHAPFVVQGKCPVNYYSKQQTARQVEFLLDTLRFDHQPRALDLGCGEGRIAIPLAKAGWDMTGLAGRSKPDRNSSLDHTV